MGNHLYRPFGINICMKTLVAILLITAAASYTHAAVRFNPYTNMWEGNVCANQYGWTYVAQYQPIGSLCTIVLPTGVATQGVIVNQ